jgi:metal-responsive CopG/Arc/MetJ family transcriptional regulator
MKVKTSITLSEDLVAQLDKVAGEIGSRSAVLEQALREFLMNRKRRKRDARDLRILNTLSDELNREAQDVLEYQVEL